MEEPTIPPRFPAGEYIATGRPTAEVRAAGIASIRELPGRVRRLVESLTPAQMGAKYRNWTVRQIVHHLADSHVNSYVRFRWTLTEDNPTIKPYDESAWARLPDADTDPAVSLRILDAIHERWVRLLLALSDADFARTYFHPESGQTVTLGEAVLSYAWHGEHHAAQIEWVRQHRAGSPE